MLPKRAVGRFSYRVEAERALIELNHAGFSLAQISLLAKYADEEQSELDEFNRYFRAEAQAEAAIGVTIGGMLGAILGCLASVGMLAIPGVGFIVAVGTGGTVITILAGAGIGAASLGLISIATSGFEIASKQAKLALDCCEQGEFLVMVEGTLEEVRRAKTILNRSCSNIWVC
jgi:hypothetical protein